MAHEDDADTDAGTRQSKSARRDDERRAEERA
jgi:hypothetical protein